MGAREIRGFAALSHDYAFTVALRVLIAICTVLLLVPVVVFVVMATRIAAARREQRLATIRLAGAVSPMVLLGVLAGVPVLAMLTIGLLVTGPLRGDSVASRTADYLLVFSLSARSSASWSLGRGCACWSAGVSRASPGKRLV